MGTVETMSNDECTEWMRFNISANDYSFSLPFGINEQMLCTKGILDEESGIYSGALGSGFRNAPAWWQRVSSFAPWIKCIKENAEKGLSHITVTRKCIKLVKRFNSNPL